MVLLIFIVLFIVLGVLLGVVGRWLQKKGRDIERHRD
jgi:hypothetical protein